MYLDRLFIGGAPEDAIGLWRPYWNPKTRFFGQLGMGFALNPFRIENHRDGIVLAEREAVGLGVEFLAVGGKEGVELRRTA